jgi:hypothetical protein
MYKNSNATQYSYIRHGVLKHLANLFRAGYLILQQKRLSRGQWYHDRKCVLPPLLLLGSLMLKKKVACDVPTSYRHLSLPVGQTTVSDKVCQSRFLKLSNDAAIEHL